MVIWLYLAVAYCAGLISGLSLWQFYGLPALERRHLSEMNALVARARLEKVRTVRGIFERIASPRGGRGP